MRNTSGSKKSRTAHSHDHRGPTPQEQAPTRSPVYTVADVPGCSLEEGTQGPFWRGGGCLTPRLHRSPHREWERPLMQAHAADPEGMVHALAGTGHEAVERHRNPESAAGTRPVSPGNQVPVASLLGRPRCGRAGYMRQNRRFRTRAPPSAARGHPAAGVAREHQGPRRRSEAIAIERPETGPGFGGAAHHQARRWYRLRPSALRRPPHYSRSR